MVDVALTQDDPPLQYFASNFADRLKDFTTYFRHKDLPEPARTCKSTLSESVDGSFTEEHGHLLSYDQQGCGEFDFSNRFKAEEVEWILNKPYVAGRTALHVEVINQRADVLEALLKHKGNPNVRDSDGQTAVHYAASQGDGIILDILVGHGGDLYLHNTHGKTPLNLLQSNNCSLYKDIIHKQLSDGFSFGDLQLVERLHDIVQQHGPLEEFRDLYLQIPLMTRPEYTYLGNQTLLFRACKVGWLDGVSFLLSKTEEASLADQVTNVTPLHAACEGSHYEIVVQLITIFPKLLLMKDKHRGWYPIHTACAYGASDEVLTAILIGLLYLVEIGGKDMLTNICFLDAHGCSPFYIAAKCGNLSHIHLMMFLFNTLQRCSPSLYATTSDNLSQVSIIHYAIAHDNRELLHILLDNFPLAIEASAYPSVFSLTHMLTHMQQNIQGLDTEMVIFPLLNSTIREDDDGKLYLTDIDAKHSVISNLALSPLAMAAAMGNTEITKILLAAGAKDNDGLALRIAMFLQYNDITKTLLTAPNIQYICEGSGKKLSALPLSVEQLSSFTEIYLQNNSLVSIPLALFQIPALKTLDISYNFITELPILDSTSESSWKCPNLSTLDISNNSFTSLPSLLWKIPNLSHIYAQYNSINKIDAPENCSVKFKEINISYNKLTTVPLCIFYSKTVNVSFNKLEELPPLLWSSKLLNNLNVANNSIEKISFPKNLCSIKLDKQQSFTSKGRRAFTTDGRTRSTYVSTKSQHGGLVKLSLANNKLQGVPEDLACFACQLQDLNISGNYIRTLYICSLPPNLKQITAKECDLQYFGTACRVVTHSAHCSHKSHINLEKLKFLKLSNNSLTVFNLISSLDASLKLLKFPELEILDLSNNGLCGELDDNIKHQRYLTALYLSGNHRLTKLPLELSCLSDTLCTLALDDLPELIDPPKEYHSGSIKRLLSYLKSRLKSSESYRKLSVMIVGDSMTGKMSLIKRGSKSKYSSNKIIIHNLEYSPSANNKTVTFRIWDFPSKKYSAINHCFYSKRAIYLVTFNLRDGTGGVIELDKYLRNIKTYAPGCPVVIVGTHLDQISEKEEDILKVILTMYSDKFTYPEIADVCCIASNESINSGAQLLKEKIYKVATHLYIAKYNRLELRLHKPSDDPDALLQQKIPKTYLNLQDQVHKLAISMEQCNEAPIMNKEKFFECCVALVEDEEELDSAVQFLHCQNELMHFEDAFLKEFYFLDIQWVFNTITRIMKIPNTNGMVLKDDVIKQSAVLIPEHCRSGFLALLAKFDFAIPCNDNYVFIHCLLPEELDSSKKALTKEHATRSASNILMPHISKIYKGISNSFAEMIEGFKSKISEAPDDASKVSVSEIAVALGDSISDNNLPQQPTRSRDFCRGRSPQDSYCAHQFPHFNIVDSSSFENSLSSSSSHQSDEKQWLKRPSINPTLHPPLRRVWLASFIADGFWPHILAKLILDEAIRNILSVLLSGALQNTEYTLNHASSDAFSLWKLSQIGLAIEFNKIKLVELRQVTNACDNSRDKYNLSEQYAYQIELTIYIPEILSVNKQKLQDSHIDTIRLATRILVIIEQLILDIGEEWFPGTISDSHSNEILSFVPCALCVRNNDKDTSYADCINQWFLHCVGHKVVCFSFKQLLGAHALPSRSAECPLHGEILVQELAPDMCFKDLQKDIICGPDIPLMIDKNRKLGSGGSALVLRGEIKYNNIRKLVAVKIINDRSNNARSLTEFLNNYTTSLHSYREIRKEVSFLSSLHHDNLTQLSGISTNPYMLLIELAPLGSLGSILKQYRAASKILSPVLLQESMLQIASALDFLHRKHVVYLDLKSDNVLVWKFPLPGHQNADQEVLLKITDYGISRMSSTANEIRYTSIAGTPGFIAPEVYTGRRQDLQSDKIDIFSFGMFLYELLTLLKPFELQSDSADALIRKNQRPKIPESSKESFTPYLIQQIMRCCWRQDPNERPTMAQVMKWSKQPELQSLRTFYSLKAKELLLVCQCNVNHLNENVVGRPENFKSIIPECESFAPLLSSMCAQSPLDINARLLDHNKETFGPQHIQIWVAHDHRKLTIVTFRSYDLGYWVHEDSATANVQAVTNVYNHMWVSTKDKLHIIETTSMKTVTCVTLANSLLEVLQLLHVPEWHMVLVLWELSEIWCIHDEVAASGVHLIGSLQLDHHIPVVRLCRVRLRGATEVWATGTDKEITVLVQSPSGCCQRFILNFTDKSLYSSHLITCLNFSTATQINVTHVWVSFDKVPKLVSWDGEDKSPLHTVLLKSTQQATSLMGHYNHLYVGTSAGMVEVYESESGDLLQLFSWHASGVNALIELPPEIKQSVCAECSSAKPMAAPHQTLAKNELVPYQRVYQESKLQRKLSGLLGKSVICSDAPLMVSIGGDLAEPVKINYENKSHDAVLLTWTGIPST